MFFCKLKNIFQGGICEARAGKISTFEVYPRWDVIVTDPFKKLKTDEKGAASVLVILIMMVLVTLGAFAITSANVNYKFSMLAFDWNAMFYSLDSKGEEYLAVLDSKLADAERMACDYVKNGKHRTAEQPEIPPDIQKEIYNGYRKTASGDNYTVDALDKIYMYYANTYLSELSPVYPVSLSYPSENEAFAGHMLIRTNILSDRPGDENNGLIISVWVLPVEYTVTESDGILSIVRSNDNLRYKIQDWYEYQKPIDGEKSVPELWDGSL